MHCFRFSRTIIAGCSLLLPVAAFSQADRGSIKGEVHDEQNRSAPGAELLLRNDGTGVEFRSTSQGDGVYTFVNLAPGFYTLTSTAAGFGKSVQQHIGVAVGTTTALDIVLHAASVEQTVTVSADNASVDTQTSEVGTVVTPREIQDLPVPMSNDSRNPLSFLTLVPGVAGSQPGASPDYRLHISGSPSSSNEVYIDGIPIMNTALAGDASLTHPPLDAISEFKVVNNNQSAQYGLASSAVSFAFKSGSNRFHGTLFEFLQNDKLNANDFVSNALGQKRAPLKQNEYGGTVSGPIWIPKVYNGHDKTFFFFEYTQFSWRPSSNNASLTTFPNRYRTGDFSQALGPQLTSANGAPIFDALGRPVLQGAIYNPHSTRTVIGPDGGSYVVRDPYPNNQIPAADFSAISKTILQSFPMANSDGINNNFFRVQATKNDEHRLVAKVDHTFTDKHNISASIFFGTYDNGNNGGLNAFDSSVVSAPTKQGRLSYN